MLTDIEKKQFRSELFRHLDGIVVAPIAFSLYKNGVLNHLLDCKKTTLHALSQKFNANDGYLNVALRVLAAQGWLNYQIKNNNVHIETNERSEISFEFSYLYEKIIPLLEDYDTFSTNKFEFGLYKELVEQYKCKFNLTESDNENTKLIQHQILKHIEGFLVGPITVHLGIGGMFHKYFMEASFSADEYHNNPDSFNVILSFLGYLGWFTKVNNNFTFTDKGLFFAKRATECLG